MRGDTLSAAMDEFFARVSKAGQVVCGRQHADGGFYCDERIAVSITRMHEPPAYPERRLAALPGWRMDRKGIWRRTTSAMDRRARGFAPKQAKPVSPELPALACCPKCGAMQWLDAERLGATPKPARATSARSKWLIRELPPTAATKTGRTREEAQ